MTLTVQDQLTSAIELPKIWAGFINTGQLENVLALYASSSTLIPTFSPEIIATPADREAYFTKLGSRPNLSINLHEDTFVSHKIAGSDSLFVVGGLYDFIFEMNGELKSFASRFTFVVDLESDSPIHHHHSSQIPTPLV